MLGTIGSQKAPAEKTVHSLESRRPLELSLSELIVDGKLEIFPHVEEKGLLFLQFRQNCVVVSAGPYVGLVPLTPTLLIDVRPKLPVSNLARILDGARAPLNSLAGSSRFYLASALASNSVLEFLAANFLDALKSLRANGLHKEYVAHSEATSHPRGRIDISGTLQSCWGRGLRHKVRTHRFEQTSDIAINRVVRQALIILLTRMRKFSVSNAGIVRNLNREYVELPRSIGDFKRNDADECQDILLRQKLPSARHYYYRVLEIALLIISNRGISLDHHGQDVQLESFIVNFETLFEAYLRHAIEVRAPVTISVKDGNRQGKKSLYDDKREPYAQPDVVLTCKKTGRKLIAEVKYKDSPNRADINQAITYALSYRTDRVILVHQNKPDAAKGLRRIGTINGIMIDAYGFDLAAESLEAEEQLLADTLFQFAA